MPGQPKPLPRPYYVLLGRDIFTKNHAVAVYGPGDGGPRPPPDPNPPHPQTQPGPNDPGSPGAIQEASLALTGVAGDTGHFVAFIEDQSATKTYFLRAGDSIARGRIKDITLDHVEYERGTYVQRVEIGQNLLGQVTAASNSASVPSPNVGVGASSPGVSTPSASAGGSSGDADASVIERLKRRHAAENGGH